MEQKIIERLMHVVLHELEPPVDYPGLTPQTPLFDEGLGLDSFAVVEMISIAEGEFGFEFSDADFLPENFENIAVFSKVIAGYLG